MTDIFLAVILAFVVGCFLVLLDIFDLLKERLPK